MPPAPKGSAYQRGDGVWCARVRTKDGRRVSVELPGVKDVESAKKEAGEMARVLHERERAAAAPPATSSAASATGETVDTWIARWFADRERRGLSSVEADRPRWSKWIAPSIGSLTMQGVRKEDIEALVERLDAAIVSGAVAWKTITNAWTLVVTAFDDACAAKVRALRVRDDNPTTGVRGPERGGKRSKAVLFPGEVLRYLRASKVPLGLRRAVALAIYTGMRAGELRALKWEDVDFESRTILVHEQIDRKGKRRETKTKRTRRVPIEPSLLPLLVAMHSEAGGVGLVLTYKLQKHTVRVFKASLARAGIERADLHVKHRDRTRVAVRLHDTRGTFCTWAAARGDSVPQIAAAAGHENITTTAGYVATADVLRAALRDVFPPLPLELFAPPGGLDTIGHGADMEPPKCAEYLWVGRDSNPGENVGDPGGSPDDWTPPAQAEIPTPPDASGTPPPGGRVEDVRRVLDGLLRLIGEAVRVLDGGDVEGALRLVSAPR